MSDLSNTELSSEQSQITRIAFPRIDMEVIDPSSVKAQVVKAVPAVLTHIQSVQSNNPVPPDEIVLAESMTVRPSNLNMLRDRNMFLAEELSIQGLKQGMDIEVFFTDVNGNESSYRQAFWDYIQLGTIEKIRRQIAQKRLNILGNPSIRLKISSVTTPTTQDTINALTGRGNSNVQLSQDRLILLAEKK